MANPFSSINNQTNNVARMHALYENQMKWVCLNNFYNHRRQQLIFAAYMMAQNNIKQVRLLQSQQIRNSCFTPQQKFSNNMADGSNQRYNSYCQPKLKNTRTIKVRGNVTEKTTIDDLKKRSNEGKLNISFPTSQQKHKNPLNTMNNPLENTATTNSKKATENIKAMVADFSNKKNENCLDNFTKNNPKHFRSSSNSSNVISINLPKNYKPSSYLNSPQGSTSSTNNQIIVTEKHAELIIYQVKEEMRGKDPENMYIKCPLCEKRIKR